jgi:hypothetical protein
MTFRHLDDLILELKGLVLVRDIRARASADDDELELYEAEIGRVRDRLADLVRTGDVLISGMKQTRWST